jgi:threonylcarbamoyladenosine tRNA methylthiotransferase MtaB
VALGRFLEAQVGMRRRALIERDGTGHTDQFAPLRVVGAAPPAGTVAEIAVAGVENGMLVGAVA